MLHLRIFVPAELTEAVMAVLVEDPAVSSLALVRGASVHSIGDLMFADVAREATNDIVDRLRQLGLHHQGSLAIEQVPTWLSQPGFDADHKTPGSSADSVVWAQVTQRGLRRVRAELDLPLASCCWPR